MCGLVKSVWLIQNTGEFCGTLKLNKAIVGLEKTDKTLELNAKKPRIVECFVTTHLIFAFASNRNCFLQDLQDSKTRLCHVIKYSIIRGVFLQHVPGSFPY